MLYFIKYFAILLDNIYKNSFKYIDAQRLTAFLNNKTCQYNFILIISGIKWH